MELIGKVIGTELDHFQSYFPEAFNSDIPLLNKILAYLAKQKGKQMRSMFVLLCARLGGDVNDSSYRAALFAEMLHTSSLVHDDVLDDSLERRGAYSVKALWNNRAAIWTGDFLFMKSVILLLSNNDHRLLKIFGGAIEKVIEGELLQMEKTRRLNLDETVYYDIIKGKTATLLAACCAAGAASTFREDAPVRKLYAFGEMLGMAFQVKDDLFDYSHTDIGKPTGNDIKEKKVTLPLLYTLNNCEPSLRKKLINIVKHKSADGNAVDFLKEAVEKSGGFTYAEKKMLLFRDEALKLLYEFPPSATRSAVEELARYVTDRSK